MNDHNHQTKSKTMSLPYSISYVPNVSVSALRVITSPASPAEFSITAVTCHRIEHDVA